MKTGLVGHRVDGYKWCCQRKIIIVLIRKGFKTRLYKWRAGNLASRWLGAGLLGLWGCPTSSASRREPPCQPHPRLHVHSSAPLDPALLMLQARPAGAVCRLLVSFPVGIGGKNEHILLYLKHCMICTKYYDYSGPCNN